LDRQRGSGGGEAEAAEVEAVEEEAPARAAGLGDAFLPSLRRQKGGKKPRVKEVD
jgi:hypothetical protein